MELRSLELLSKEYPNIQAASAEVINLNAIKCLPKGTEYFFSDLHGEYEGFSHLLRSASGVIRTKIEDLFGRSISLEEREFLAELIYYPEHVLKNLKLNKKEGDKQREEWERIILYRLIRVCKKSSTKYTRSKVRKKMPPEYAYILDELLHADEGIDKEYYYQEIIQSIIDMGSSESLIIAICTLIQDLCIDQLHIIGDIYDRGPRPDIIIDELRRFHAVDIQWGNHDISWMGAACGNYALVANVVRMAVHYNNFDLVEDGYGISLRALSTFATEVYGEDDCKHFIPNVWDENKYAPVSLELAAKMHKAITIIQFKLEGQLIKAHPEYDMEERACLLNIDYEKGIYRQNGREYPIKDMNFPTIDPADPLKLTKGEQELITVLRNAFKHSSALQRQMQYVYSHGSLYKCVNNNLLYHGCIPMTKDGEFEEFSVNGETYKGKALMDWINNMVNRAFYYKEKGPKRKQAVDFMWYLWCGSKSPVFGKNRMSTFEQYFLDAPAPKKEVYNPYYELSRKEEICDKILAEFGLGGAHSHIINGHVPVKMKDGESPIRGNGKLFVIDGGISKAYQSKTGIAGYTLIYNSRTLNLAQHRPYSEHTQTPKVSVIEVMHPRVTVNDTDIGKQLARQTEELTELIQAYRLGKIKQHFK